MKKKWGIISKLVKVLVCTCLIGTNFAFLANTNIQNVSATEATQADIDEVNRQVAQIKALIIQENDADLRQKKADLERQKNEILSATRLELERHFQPIRDDLARNERNLDCEIAEIRRKIKANDEISRQEMASLQEQENELDRMIAKYDQEYQEEVERLTLEASQKIQNLQAHFNDQLIQAQNFLREKVSKEETAQFLSEHEQELKEILTKMIILQSLDGDPSASFDEDQEIAKTLALIRDLQDQDHTDPNDGSGSGTTEPASEPAFDWANFSLPDELQKKSSEVDRLVQENLQGDLQNPEVQEKIGHFLSQIRDLVATNNLQEQNLKDHPENQTPVEIEKCLTFDNSNHWQHVLAYFYDHANNQELIADLAPLENSGGKLFTNLPPQMNLDRTGVIIYDPDAKTFSQTPEI